MGRTTKVSVFLICSLVIAVVHAEVYKWIDDQGKVHYSDAPPRGAVSKKIELPVTTPQQRENAQERLKAFLKQRKAQEAIHNQAEADKREAQATKLREREERLGRCLAAQEQLDSVLHDAEDPQFHALTGSEIMSLKEVRKSYCVGARPGPGARAQSEAVKRNACEELRQLAPYLMSAQMSAGAVSFSAMVDGQCRHYKACEPIF